MSLKSNGGVGVTQKLVQSVLLSKSFVIRCTGQMEMFNGGAGLSSSCFPTSALYRDQANA